jgi:hypothetical protein
MSAEKSNAVRIEDPYFLGRAKKGAAMLNDLYMERNVAKRCEICGRVRDLFELPGRPEKFCLECSADLATVIQLSTEIGAAARAGGSTDRKTNHFVLRLDGNWGARARRVCTANSKPSITIEISDCH